MITPELGLYEQLINKLFYNKLQTARSEQFFVKTTVLDKEEAARYLSQYLAETIRFALSEFKGDDSVLKQVELSNKIIQILIDELPKLDISHNLLENGEVLQAVFSRLDYPYTNLGERLKKITPYTRLSQSELFTGNNVGVSLESEIRKEILSSDEIYWLVSFIKFSGIRIFKEELEEFTNSGRKLKIITTSYMGATEAKAVEFLSGLRNTEVKVSYNGDHERLHAKAYLFLRNTGFHTGYIGSSNLSRSALTDGLEWNLKVTTREIGHIIDKFKKTFETYWEDKEFEYYQAGRDREKLNKALRIQKTQDRSGLTAFFDINPYPFQQEILSKLESERLVHNRCKNLVVAATGTGKTVISAFDYKRFKSQSDRARLLFITHRKEILVQAQDTFRHVLRDANFGELWVDGMEPGNLEFVFASVQTLRNRIGDLKISADFYDFIIIDEVHHAPANSYRFIFDRFLPKVLLGLTATPERSDGEDILKDFCDTIAAEIRLPEAINRKLLSPFQYFAVSDSVDLTKVAWRNGRYDINELTNLYTAEDRRVAEILENCDKYLTDLHEVRALGFCVSQAHAQYMAEKFILRGLKADYLTSSGGGGRDGVRDRLRNKEINYLFVVDIFNEGVDIPEIDTVLFLRPTESLTIFLQQLGRGLRLADSKECLTVLDFVGNANAQYDFDHKFRALVGKTHTSIDKEIEDEFPHLPLGCSIILEKRAKEAILRNIRTAIGFNKNQLTAKIRSFRLNSTLPLTLKNFLEFNRLELPLLYKKGSWKRLLAAAGMIADFAEPQEKELTKFMTQRVLQSNSYSYLNFIKRMIREDWKVLNPTPEEEVLLLMLHYDVWREAGPKLGYRSVTKSLAVMRNNPVMVSELEELVDYLIDKIDFVEKDIELSFPSPLKVHSRYNQDQILTALGFHTFEKASSHREGVASNKQRNVEALFITLKKSEKEYSPTTLYDDYAISDYLFHWQSQNATSPETPKGQSYLQHREQGKTILLFVREQNQDEYRNTMSYVFLGDANFIKSSGSKPMNIEWRLTEPMPAYLWKESRKLAVG